MESICKYMSVKNYSGSIKTINFVYEAEFKTLKQPFLRPVYYIHLVTNGEGIMKIYGEKYELKCGSVFLAFPGCPYEIEADENFKYIYISFMGSCVGTIFENLEIDIKKPVYYNMGNIQEFWLSSILRVNNVNSNLIAESVLLYTLSFINNKGEEAENAENAETVFELVVDYVDGHYRDKDISLGKIADVFSYTEKYLSHVFKKNMKIGFNTYLNNLRIQYASELLAVSHLPVSEISSLCGYSDPLYFSKVFKKRMGVSPTGYKKKQK